jgi:hypothetical protein
MSTVEVKYNLTNDNNNNWLQHPGNNVLGSVLPARLIWELVRPKPFVAHIQLI